jgi:hypothetical protein
MINLISLFCKRYGIAPKLNEETQKPRIEVFNPCDDSDDQKTSTAILFDNDQNFLAFGNTALRKYAEMLEDDETALLFLTVNLFYLLIHIVYLV